MRINLLEIAEKYRKAGYSDRNADAHVCQDIVLKAIEGSNLKRNVTIKGGVVMHNITGNVRRATEDLDLDFIRYSLEDESIRFFISNRQYRNHIEHSGDRNWLQIDVEIAFKMIQEFLNTVDL